MSPTSYDTFYHATSIILMFLNIIYGVLEFVSLRRSAPAQSPTELGFTQSLWWVLGECMVSLILSVTIVVLFFSPNTEVLLIVMLCFSRFLITLQVVRVNSVQLLIDKTSLQRAFNIFFTVIIIITTVLAISIVLGVPSYIVTESVLAMAAIEGCLLNFVYIRRYVILQNRATVGGFKLLLSIVAMTISCIGVTVLVLLNSLFSMDILSIWIYILLISLGLIRSICYELWQIG